MERGRLDLVLNADDGHLPARLASEVIFEDDFVCVAAKESRYTRALTLRTVPWRTAHRSGNSGRARGRFRKTAGGDRGAATLPDLGSLFCNGDPQRGRDGPDRHGTAAYGGNGGGELRGPCSTAARDPGTRFRYLMAWHPRMATDAGHVGCGSDYARGKSLGKTDPAVIAKDNAARRPLTRIRQAEVAQVDMKLFEVVVIPVSDAGRAKAFYVRLGSASTPITPTATTTA